MWAPAAFERTKKPKYYCKIILKQSLLAYASTLWCPANISYRPMMAEDGILLLTLKSIIDWDDDDWLTQ